MTEITITAKLAPMFAEVSPYDVCHGCSFRLAQRIAMNHADWLVSDLDAAAEGMRAWARETGAWEEDEIKAWPVIDCLAMFVQVIGAELDECLDVNRQTLEECVDTFIDTDWNHEPQYPTGTYYMSDDSDGSGEPMVDFYTGL